MSWSSIAMAAGIVLAVIYIALAFSVVTHVDREKKPLLSSRWPVFFFWWPFYSDIYDESARKLRLYGQVLFTLMVMAYVVSFAMR